MKGSTFHTPVSNLPLDIVSISGIAISGFVIAWFGTQSVEFALAEGV